MCFHITSCLNPKNTDYDETTLLKASHEIDVRRCSQETIAKLIDNLCSMAMDVPGMIERATASKQYISIIANSKPILVSIIECKICSTINLAVFPYDKDIVPITFIINDSENYDIIRKQLKIHLDECEEMFETNYYIDAPLKKWRKVSNW